MNETKITENSAFYPPANLCWADYLYIFGLFVYAIAGNFSISASQTGLSLSLIGFIGLYRLGRVNIRRTPLEKPFAFLIAAAVLSCFRANESFKALSEIKSFLIIMVFYLTYWPEMSKDFQNRLLSTFIFSAVLVSIVNNYNILAGFSEGKHTRGFFSMCITFGECMSLAGLTVLLRLGLPSKSKTEYMLHLIALLFISVSMIQSLTRGAWLGFFAGSTILAVRFPRKLVPLLLILALVASIIALQHPAFKERLTGFNMKKTIEAANRPMSLNNESIALFSNLQRLYIWLRGFKMTDNAFVFGVGARNVKTHYKRLAGEYEHRLNLIWGHQHNNFMQIFAMYGIIGLIAFFYFIIETVKFLIAGKLDRNSLSTGAIAIFSGFLFFGFTEYSWGDEEVIMMAMFLTGLLMNSNFRDQLPENFA